jgi:hypothetical protein
MPFPEGPWSSYVRMAPISFPNDGVFFVNPPNGEGVFTGIHHRPPFDNTTIEGRFTPATGGDLDHITFTETYNGVTYKYDADIIKFRTTFFVTFNGKRSIAGPAAADEDWAGTHTT